MIKRLVFLFLFFYTVCFILTAYSYPEESEFDINEVKKDAPKVFLDGRCDRDYIRTEIPYVNYVRDRKGADDMYSLQPRQPGLAARNTQLHLSD